MGFNIKTTELLIFSKSLGVEFDRVLSIGRQRLHGSRFLFERLFRRYGFSQADLDTIILDNDRYCEHFLKILGASEVDSIDASNYEHATLIHDMNNPISDQYKNRYSAVIDSGSLEHIFNFPVAIKNCMEMVVSGGHFVGVTPTNNFSGHGFYQFSPELLYRVFSSENGFSVKKMFLFFDDYRSPIFEVSDPLEVKDRVRLKNSRESFLFFVAQRHNVSPIFATTPQQSDYFHFHWQKSTATEKKKQENMRSILRKMLPKQVVILALHFRSKYSHLLSLLSPIGNANRRFFKRYRIR